MVDLELAPRHTRRGIVWVWIVAAVFGLAIGLFVPSEWWPAWLVMALGGCLFLSFIVQLRFGQPHGFIERVSVSVLGSLVVLSLLSLGFALAAISP